MSSTSSSSSSPQEKVSRTTLDETNENTNADSEQLNKLNNSSNDNDNQYKFRDPDIKMILLGDSAVGKSKLIERYLECQYNKKRLSTHSLTLYQKTMDLSDGTHVCCDFWDTAGQEKFNSMHASYYYEADVCILVFDVTRKQTYLNLKKWYRELREHCEDIPCLLVANKIDCDYRVTRKNFKFAGDNRLPFYFVSSADGTNVVKVFEEAILAGLGHKKFAVKGFVAECLELFDDAEFFAEP